MEALLEQYARYVGLTLEAIAVLMIAIGSIEALIGVVRVLVRSNNASNHDKRRVWLLYTRWLVAALTFQLAADIVHTSFAGTWNDVGRLAAIAVIRTFLTYFLDRDMERTRELQIADSEATAR